jgi:hypothetical protein
MRVFRVVTSWVLILAAATAVEARQRRWYELYDEAIRHVQQGQWNEAEQKLLQAMKSGTRSGRSVLRYGSLRDDYFPEFYLGVIYLKTGRAQEALQQFAAARKANLNPQDSEFRSIADYESEATKATSRAAAPTTPAAPVPTAPAPAPAPAPNYGEQIGKLLATARAQLAQRNYNEAEQSANSARDIAVKQSLAPERTQAEAFLREVNGGRIASRVEEALTRRDPQAARRELNALVAALPDYRVDGLRTRIEQLENEGRVAAAGAVSKQFEEALSVARTQLTQGNFDVATQRATTARDLAIKQNLAAERTRAEALLREVGAARLAARVEDAVKRRDPAAARRELDAVTAAFPDYNVSSLRDSVAVLERQVRGEQLQRNAMRAFFGGSYQQALAALAEAEKLNALTARGYFYRACSLAAQAAATAKPAEDRRVADAKRSYAAASRARSEFQQDLRYISPKIRRLLGIS